MGQTQYSKNPAGIMLTLNYETLTQAVIAHACNRPNDLTLVFFKEDGSREEISSQAFHQEALGFACALKDLGVQADDLVILVLKHTKMLVSSFWGALYLGAVASIFPYLTEKLDPQIYKERIKALVTHERARVVITFPEFKEELSALLSEAGCQVLSTAEVPQAAPGLDAENLWNNPQGEKIAFLQHSSGTTGLQKGVALSHRSVLNQIKAYSQAISLTEADVIVSWLPLYHDMGLIAGLVMPIVAGIPLVMMSPFHWVRDPKSLFRAITEYHGTLCWLPNFAFNHLVRGIRPKDIQGFDLRSLRAVINCSEPVRQDSLQNFQQKYAPIGISQEMLASCYAMAENTFAVTQSPPGSPPMVDWVITRAMQEEKKAIPGIPANPGTIPMVSCGMPIPGTKIRIVDEKRCTLPERHVGEILLHSNCMLSGYYRREELNERAIIDGWYATEDIGYIADGELYVSGRKKDLIIVGGKNVFPQDIEAIANMIPGIHPGRAVAFGVLDEQMGSEAVVVVAELDDENADDGQKRTIEQDLRKKIVQQTEVTLADVRLVGPRWLIKTSSGKIARAANRDKYLAECADQPAV